MRFFSLISMLVVIVLISGCIDDGVNKSDLNNPVSVCKQIDSEILKTACLGIAKRDVSLCEKTDHVVYKNTCLAVVTDKYSICFDIEKEGWGLFYESCLQDFAWAKKDISICEMKKDSVSYCYFILGIMTKDPLACQRIDINSHTGPRDKNTCLAIVNEDVLTCNNLKDERSKTRCISIAEKDSSKCGEDLTCFQQLAFINKDASLCEKFDGTTKDNCYYRVALMMMN